MASADSSSPASPWTATRLTMVASVGLLAAAVGGLYLFGGSRPATVALVALTGFVLSGVPTAMQSRILHVAPGRTDLASAGNSAAFNVGIAGGALVGGVMLPTVCVRSVALAGALFAAAAFVVVVCEPLIARAGRHRIGDGSIESVDVSRGGHADGDRARRESDTTAPAATNPTVAKR